MKRRTFIQSVVSAIGLSSVFRPAEARLHDEEIVAGDEDKWRSVYDVESTLKYLPKDARFFAWTDLDGQHHCHVVTELPSRVYWEDQSSSDGNRVSLDQFTHRTLKIADLLYLRAVDRLFPLMQAPTAFPWQ